ncbi:hypothetical protein Agabi119p4_9674 [Agaricus bisporus var. burnettii]|uniref:F-box domain-containing protein n=1 Tax=Agaricus bisporus var. burnettii TaxID=192524 RepID=A0A8H7EX87_AGABI|nr:hypothetical protein Agabi119p4_9674 [Agaricus bisporus var. burnettii]
MQRITDFLPLEVCESIALLLDLGTVLTLRCTCKMFLNATNSWRVWANLARYIALEPLFSVPDEPPQRRN